MKTKMILMGLLMTVSVMIPQVLFSQDTVLYKQKNGDYSIMLTRNTTLSTSTVSNGYVETFTTRSEDNSFRYVIILSKNAKGESTFEDFLKIEFENGFKKSCGCEIIQKLQHKVEKSNKRSVRFEIIAQDSETLFRGYSDNLIHNQSMYNILFLCSDQTFTEFKEEYEAILSSFDPTK